MRGGISPAGGGIGRGPRPATRRRAATESILRGSAGWGSLARGTNRRKSPAVVPAGGDIDPLAPRFIAGKLLNAGQTCIAPDYVLAPASRVDAICDALARAVATLYPTLEASPDYASIVNDRHYARLVALIDDASRKGARVVRLNPGNELLPERTRKLAPTLLVGVRDDMAAMHEEIFGPVLPIESYATLDEAIAKINARPRPLALYAFGGDAQARERG